MEESIQAGMSIKCFNSRLQRTEYLHVLEFQSPSTWMQDVSKVWVRQISDSATQKRIWNYLELQENSKMS